MAVACAVRDSDSPVAGESERRGAARISMLLLAVIKYDELRPSETVRVLDICADGLRAKSSLTLDRGHPVKVTLKGLGPISAKIAWARNSEIGIRFDERINLSAVTQSLTGVKPASHIEFASKPTPRPGFRIR